MVKGGACPQGPCVMSGTAQRAGALPQAGARPGQPQADRRLRSPGFQAQGLGEGSRFLFWGLHFLVVTLGGWIRSAMATFFPSVWNPLSEEMLSTASISQTHDKVG